VHRKGQSSKADLSGDQISRLLVWYTYVNKLKRKDKKKIKNMALNITGAGTLPPIFPITDEDHGGYAAVSLYTLLALSVFVVATRLSARYYIGKVVQVDDYLLGVGTVSDT
jgi:hypothetical protein